MSEVTIGLIGIAFLLALFLTGIEIGFAMGIVGFIGFSCIVSLQAGLNLLATDFFETFSSYNLSVIPLFILMGQIAFNAGIAKRLYGMAYKFIGFIPGGLAIATVAGATVFKSICGSSPATAATFASIAVPEMDKYNYRRVLSTGVVAVVGTLGMLLPPSVVLILLGLVTNLSIGRLFLAGIIPGLIVAFLYVLVIVGWSKVNPSLAPAGERFSMKERMASLPEGLWVLIIFIVVIGGLLQGFFTPTEAGSIGVFAVLVLSILKKDIDFNGYVKSVAEALRTACMCLVLLAGSALMGHFLSASKIPMIAAEWFSSLPVDPVLVLIMICFVYLIGGSFIEDLAFMILATPIFFPTVLKLGFDPIWFCIVVSVVIMFGEVIPPVASLVFIVKNITHEPIGVIYRGVYPFLIGLFLLTVALFVFPQICLFLPNLLMGK